MSLFKLHNLDPLSLSEASQAHTLTLCALQEAAQQYIAAAIELHKLAAELQLKHGDKPAPYGVRPDA